MRCSRRHLPCEASKNAHSFRLASATSTRQTQLSSSLRLGGRVLPGEEGQEQDAPGVQSLTGGSRKQTRNTLVSNPDPLIFLCRENQQDETMLSAATKDDTETPGSWEPVTGRYWHLGQAPWLLPLKCSGPKGSAMPARCPDCPGSGASSGPDDAPNSHWYHVKGHQHGLQPQCRPAAGELTREWERGQYSSSASGQRSLTGSGAPRGPHGL